MALDGSKDNVKNSHGDLEVAVPDGLVPAWDDPAKAPEVSTRKKDIQPDVNPISSQTGNSNPSPFSKLSSPPTSPRKRDRIKNFFKGKP